jgi:amidase
MSLRRTYMPAEHALANTFGDLMPVAHLRSGDVLSTYTEDFFGGAVQSVDDLPSRACALPNLNPVTGPFFVEDAEPGDTLAVHFISVVPARSVGVSSTFPHFGALTSTARTATVQPSLEERVWLHEIDVGGGVLRFRARDSDFTVHLPLDPMHSTVGVAPAGHEARGTMTCGPHGGRLGSDELRAGTTLYLGVNVHGAMLSLGDGRARGKRCEVFGVSVAVAMHTSIGIEVIKRVATPWPRIESDESILSVGCARRTEDAFRIGQHDLVGWTSELTGLGTLDVHELITQAGTVAVGTVRGPDCTILVRLDKKLLGDAAAYAGAHRRLRQLSPPTTVGASC